MSRGRATLLGYNGGAFIKDPAVFGLDFAFTAVFISLLVGMWHGKRDFFPWLVAALAAVIAEHFLPGKWYILVGALSGSLVEVFRHEN